MPGYPLYDYNPEANEAIRVEEARLFIGATAGTVQSERTSSEARYQAGLFMLKVVNRLSRTMVGSPARSAFEQALDSVGQTAALIIEEVVGNSGIIFAAPNENFKREADAVLRYGEQLRQAVS